MTNQIRITPDQMRERANQYRAEADTVNGVINKMDSLLQQLQERVGRRGKRILRCTLSGIEAQLYEG